MIDAFVNGLTIQNSEMSTLRAQSSAIYLENVEYLKLNGFNAYNIYSKFKTIRTVKHYGGVLRC